VAGELAVSAEPREGALDDPALGFDDEAAGAVRALDDLDASVAGAMRGHRFNIFPERFLLVLAIRRLART
jgi:hypothetical protein